MDISSVLESASLPELPKNKQFRIGVVGAGFIVRECHLAAYRKLGFNPIAITSLSLEESGAVAKSFNIPTVHPDWKRLIDDESVEILDIAVPPHVQPDIVRYACAKKHIKGILCQKPMAMDYAAAVEVALMGRESGVPIAVNSNMRYDQSMRALKYCVEHSLLGTPVLASFEQRAVPHWQKFAQSYSKLTFLNFSIHELDIFRHLFGDPELITASCRTDPRFSTGHSDGIVQYTYNYENGFMATSLDDTFAWPGEPCQKDTYINWRVVGLDGLAKGTIGWPKFPELCPSTLALSRKSHPEWVRPAWNACWFPDAFGGTMASLLRAVENGEEPEISAADHAITIACVDACYRSIEQKRSVSLQEIIDE